ncbi:hypothetical protein O3M35_004920 [Rhynocoris fuscipes]|uniref:Uncharacterized protein n=1 Tax=Rhynocoris fuscipes TaxID=488301 RepID=A0AAW1DI13_9HEMI
MSGSKQLVVCRVTQCSALQSKEAYAIRRPSKEYTVVHDYSSKCNYETVVIRILSSRDRAFAAIDCQILYTEYCKYYQLLNAVEIPEEKDANEKAFNLISSSVRIA